MQLSATLLYNAIRWVDGGHGKAVPAPYSNPHKGLLSTHNRGFWLLWDQVEKSPGVYDWTVADNWIDEQLRQGLLPVVVITNPPPFHRTGKSPTSGAADSVEPGAWRDWVTMLVRRYVGRLKHIEIGNEFDTSGPNEWLYGDNEEMGRMWRIAHDAAKAVDPEIFVVLGSIQSLSAKGEGLRDLALALDAFDGPPDAVSVHVYPDSYYPMAEVAQRLHEVRGVMIAHGAPHAQLWVTEFGREPEPLFCNMTPKEQGAWLRAVFRQLRDGRVDVALFWEFDDANPDFGGFGFKDHAEGIKVWNDAVQAVFGRA